MPKAQKRRKVPVKTSASQSRIASASQSVSGSRKVPDAQTSNGNAARMNTVSANRRFLSPTVSGPQNLIFPGMVAVGCWLMAFTLIFLTNDPNRYLFGGMAVLMALFWTFNFVVRVRKLLLRQRSHS